MRVKYFNNILYACRVGFAVLWVVITISCVPSVQENNKYTVSDYTDIHKIPYDPGLPLNGAAKGERSSDVKPSPYYPSYDFYNLKSTEDLIILENFKTIQQMTHVTCGPVSVAMVLAYYNKLDGHNEQSLKALRGTQQDTTYLRHLITIFDQIGGFEYESTFTYETPENFPKTLFIDYLKKGIPVIIGTNEWGGHWQVVIGYDTMGTETISDDVLILAEPYDTTDHNQDGYTITSVEKLYYGNWRNYFDPDYNWGLFLAVWPKG